MNNEQVAVLSTRRTGPHARPRSAGLMRWSLVGCICDQEISDPDPRGWSEPQKEIAMRKGVQEKGGNGSSRPTAVDEAAALLALEIALPIACVRNNALAALNFLDRQSPDLDEVREALNCLVEDVDRTRDIIDRVRGDTKGSVAANGRS